MSTMQNHNGRGGEDRAARNDKRDFAAKGALIIRGAVGARSWHQTLISVLGAAGFFI
jgi:hypothetical protein